MKCGLSVVSNVLILGNLKLRDAIIIGNPNINLDKKTNVDQ